MNPYTYILVKITFLSFISVLLFTAVMVVPCVSHAGVNESRYPDNLGNISASHGDVIDSKETVLQKHTSVSGNFATRNEQGVASSKNCPKTKKVILGAILISIMVFTLINLLSAGYNTRICSNCGYAGSMTAVTLSKNQFVNSWLIFLVRFFPVVLYCYSERGRFLCPECRRTSANVSMKRKIREINN